MIKYHQVIMGTGKLCTIFTATKIPELNTSITKAFKKQRHITTIQRRQTGRCEMQILIRIGKRYETITLIQRSFTLTTNSP
ncbi:hypothetical protein BFG07_08505 [Kosakonia cowanii]|nr:hypothetical protein BFG07_08505 [Kosakonia cowanii]